LSIGTGETAGLEAVIPGIIPPAGSLHPKSRVLGASLILGLLGLSMAGMGLIRRKLAR